MSAAERPSRIAVVADHFHPVQMPAEARINTGVVTRLAGSGNQVHLFCTQGAVLPDELSSVELHPVSASWGLSTVIRLARDLGRGQYDDVLLMYDAGSFGRRVWITLLPWLLRLGTGFSGRFVAHFTNAVRAPFSPSLARILRGLNRLGLRWIDGAIGGLCAADRLAFYCEDHRDSLLGNQPHLLARSVLSPAPLTVDLHPLPEANAPALRQQLGFDAGRPLILFFGLVYPLKGIEFLLYAADLLHKRGMPVQVAIVGEHGGITANEEWRRTCQEYWERMQTLTRELGLDKQVRWAGHVDEADLPRWLAAADLACFPFVIGIRANNSSFSVCAAYGLPVVTTDGDQVDAIFREPGNGVTLAPRRRADLLADCIEELLQNPPRLARMREEILAFHRRHFRWDVFVRVLVGD